MAYIGGPVALTTMILPNGQISVLDSKWMVILSFFCVRHLLRVQVGFPDGAIRCPVFGLREGQQPLGLFDCNAKNVASLVNPY